MRCRILFLCLIFLSLSAYGQKSNYEKYIDKYHHYATDQMKRYGIPASITLAQGLLESSAGTSYLARKANNHFGIKVGGGWKGPYVIQSDDLPNDRFRVYRSVKASYEDHSLFLYGKPRYADLFKLSQKDYKGWAHGLKKAGYATNPRYAYLLIDLIERYDLTQYDKKGGKRNQKKNPLDDRVIRMCNESFYLIAEEGDTYKSLSKIVGKSERKLRKYNEVDKNYSLEPGDVVYLEKKEKKADKSHKKKYHAVRVGESMHSIAQRYGMRMETLYKINRKSPGYLPKCGDLLLIRK